MISTALKKAFRQRLETESLRYIAQQTQIDAATLCRWHKGNGTLTQAKADILAEYLGLSLVAR